MRVCVCVCVYGRWNDLPDLEYLVEFVSEHKLGGVFSWIATSDAPDWRVHKHINRLLRG